jgi:hypothetical protein
MSKQELLNESTIRRMMKLASIDALSEDFVGSKFSRLVKETKKVTEEAEEETQITEDEDFEAEEGEEEIPEMPEIPEEEPVEEPEGEGEGEAEALGAAVANLMGVVSDLTGVEIDVDFGGDEEEAGEDEIDLDMADEEEPEEEVFETNSQNIYEEIDSLMQQGTLTQEMLNKAVQASASQLIKEGHVNQEALASALREMGVLGEQEEYFPTLPVVDVDGYVDELLEDADVELDEKDVPAQAPDDPSARTLRAPSGIGSLAKRARQASPDVYQTRQPAQRRPMVKESLKKKG